MEKATAEAAKNPSKLWETTRQIDWIQEKKSIFIIYEKQCVENAEHISVPIRKC